jgi:hypothetical protein
MDIVVLIFIIYFFQIQSRTRIVMGTNMNIDYLSYKYKLVCMYELDMKNNVSHK